MPAPGELVSFGSDPFEPIRISRGEESSSVDNDFKVWLRIEVSRMLQNHLDQMDFRLNAALHPLKQSIERWGHVALESQLLAGSRAGAGSSTRSRAYHSGLLGRASKMQHTASSNRPAGGEGRKSNNRKSVSSGGASSAGSASVALSSKAKELIARSSARDRASVAPQAASQLTGFGPRKSTYSSDAGCSSMGSLGSFPLAPVSEVGTWWEAPSTDFGPMSTPPQDLPQPRPGLAASLQDLSKVLTPSEPTDVSYLGNGLHPHHHVPCRLPKPKAAEHSDLDDVLPPEESPEVDKYKSCELMESSQKAHYRESVESVINFGEDVQRELDAKRQGKEIESRRSSDEAGTPNVSKHSAFSIGSNYSRTLMPKNTMSSTTAGVNPVGSATSAPYDRQGQISRALTTVLRPGELDADEENLNNMSTRIRFLLEDSSSSFAAWVYSIIMGATIVLSSITSLLQTCKPPVFPSRTFPAVLEICFDSIFLTEVLVHWAVSANPCTFFLMWANIIDILSAAPSLALRIAIGVVPPDDVDDKDPAIFFASLIYAVEAPDDIESLPHALWLTVVTMTTVGYGDVTPKTGAGISITSVLVISSAFYMAVPLGIVGNTFSNVWEDRDRLLMIQKARVRFLQAGYKPADIPDLFALFGGECGELNLHDFQTMVEDMNIGINRERIIGLFNTFDTDMSGTIDHREFVRALFPSNYAAIYGTTCVEEEYESSIADGNSIAGSARTSFHSGMDHSGLRMSDAFGPRRTTQDSRY